jgi:hypothetical protein
MACAKKTWMTKAWTKAWMKAWRGKRLFGGASGGATGARVGAVKPTAAGVLLGATKAPGQVEQSERKNASGAFFAVVRSVHAAVSHRGSPIAVAPGVLFARIALGVLVALFVAGAAGMAGGFFAPEAAAAAAAKEAKVVFARDGGVWLTDVAGGTPRRLCDGNDPEISPRGDAVAFTDYRDAGRRIAVLRLGEKTAQLVAGIPGDNSYGPRWSPDGMRLLFNHWLPDEARWVTAVVSASGGDLRLVSGAVRDVYSPFWAADGASVYAQDLEFLYRFDLQGQMLEKRSLAELFGDAVSFSSAVRFSVAPDGSAVLFDADLPEMSPLAQKVGEPVSAVFLWRPASGEQGARVSPEDMSVFSPAWLPDGSGFLAAGFSAPDVKGKGASLRLLVSLYRFSLDGGAPVRLVKDAFSPSCSK